MPQDKPFKLLKLPVELLQETFTNLRVPTILCLRRTCKQLKTMVDDNERGIAEAICKRELSRLKDFIDYEIYCIDDRSFLEALRRMGPPQGMVALFKQSFLLFGEHWHDKVCQAEVGASVSSNFVLGIESASFTATCLVSADGLFHARPDQYSTLYYQDRALSLAGYKLRMETHFPGSELGWQSWEATVWSIGGADELDVPGPRHHHDFAVDDVAPGYLVTDLRYPVLEDANSMKTRTAYGQCSTQDLFKFVGAPEIPRSKVFAYCLIREWALKLVRNATVYRGELSPLQRACLMQLLEIY